MKFYEHPTAYTESRRIGLMKLPPLEFYSTMLSRLDQMAKDKILPTAGPAEINQIICEQRWYQRGTPYFKIWPEMIEVLCTTRIDDITGEHLVLPYKEFSIRLPEENDLVVAPGYPIRTILLSESDHILHGRDIIPERQLLLWINFDERDPELGDPIHTYRMARILSEESLEVSFHKLPTAPNYFKGIQIPEEILRAVLRLAIGVCLLSTSASKVVEPDILARHLDVWKTASEDRRLELVRKAQRLGKIGWRVHNPEDTSRQLVGCLSAAIRDEHEARTTGRPLKYQHQRRAHWHLVRHGPQHSLVKPMLFPETTVGKALPRKDSK